MSATRPRRLLTLVAGFLLWHLALLGLYALNFLGCAFGPAAGAEFLSLQRLALLGLWAAHLGALCALAWFFRRRQRADAQAGEPAALLGFVAFGGALWALLATALFGLPLFAASACL